MFEIKNVSKQYNKEFALNDISMDIGKGLNFIIGASGSGKTTLLKIISGMEQDFDGEVSYCGRAIKELTANEKSYFYNNIFGFVWQDFNLLEDLTVIENVLLPQYLKDNQSNKTAEKLLKDLKLFNLATQKVKYLSGGQKQRVAIARELMKNPQVIIADEPTSALDEKTSKTTMEILRVLAKSKTVIVVTHDTSLITEKDKVFELDKGELISKPEMTITKSPQLKMDNRHCLSIKNSFSLTKSNIKSKIGRFAVATLSIMVAAVLLLTTVSGSITSSGQNELDKLIETYGEGLLDINIVGSFMGASGTGGKDDEQGGSVKQDISGYYDKYIHDARVEHALLITAFNDISVSVNGKSYAVEKSNSYPYMNKIIEGRTPNGTGNEVIVPEKFVKSMGISNKDAIGKEIEFNCSIYNWDSGEPVPMNAKTKANIVGVVDTTVVTDNNGKKFTYNVDDTFIFSKSALNDLRSQAKLNNDKTNFTIRAKSPADMISLKDEFNKSGIVPTGRFELVEDLVRLNNQTTKQSGSASVVIAILSLVMVVAIFFITGFMRKREYAIYKVSGFNTRNLNLLNLCETLSYGVFAIVLMLVTSPVLNLATSSMFGVNILSGKMLFVGVLLIIITAVISSLVTAITYIKTNLTIALKAGDR